MEAMTEVKAIYQDPQSFDGKEVTVGGWVRSNRDSKTVGFLTVSDGSCFQTLQIVYTQELADYQDVTKYGVGAAVIAKGRIVLTPQAKQPFEMQAEEILLEGATTPD